MSAHMLFNVLCQQTDKKALAQYFSFNFERRRKKCECHNHNAIKTNGNYTSIQQKVGESHLKWKSKGSQVSSLWICIQTFPLLFPFLWNVQRMAKLSTSELRPSKWLQSKKSLDYLNWVCGFFYMQYKCYFQFTTLFCSW